MKDSASDLSRLDPYGEEGILHMVVETPRGVSIKLAYAPGLGTLSPSVRLRSGSPIP